MYNYLLSAKSILATYPLGDMECTQGDNIRLNNPLEGI